jgi:hypothetical protein
MPRFLKERTPFGASKLVVVTSLKVTEAMRLEHYIAPIHNHNLSMRKALTSSYVLVLILLAMAPLEATDTSATLGIKRQLLAVIPRE